jgi:ubiquinol-cytochrome c reductase iron-sulfur subunit
MVEPPADPDGGPGEKTPPAPDETPGDRPPLGMRGTEVAIAIGFAAAIAGAIGLAVCYGLGGQPQVEGVLLFVTLGGIGFGIAAWGKYLMPNGPFEQAREPMTSTAVERESAMESIERGTEELGRRRFLRRLLVGSFGALGVALLFPIKSLGPNPDGELQHTSWFKGSRLLDTNGNAVRPGDVAVGGVVTVFPESAVGDANSQTLLIHVADTPVVTRPGRETWSPMGYLAFSKVCTHAGCPVGLYEHRTEQLLCPCHQSLFDVPRGALPVFGPAPRSLPQLPLALSTDGYLIAQSDYLEPIGPTFWSRS